ncbi:hypothetical protein F511_24656 [Dorcoceras hygrometricum]|uniref:Uncharacterized protein n=1 Tax=Dorcoceras hygrometricum TaxID=472368 RepID=A0A2Z7CDK8_9LAMI|nr:hypothetical protein F511_24656 [Dorcoceras hygrometricum]
MPSMTTSGPEDRATHLKPRYAPPRSRSTRGLIAMSGVISRGPCLDLMKRPAQTSKRITYFPPVPDAPEFPDVVVLDRRLR